MTRHTVRAAAAGLSLLAAMLVGVSGCREHEPSAPDHTHKATLSSFEQIQTHVFAPGCALSGCHAGASPAGELSLEGAGVYTRLVNTEPANVAARADGLRRVTPGDPEASFLFIKLREITKAAYGARMPLGSHALSAGQIEFIRTWIERGAPETGEVADPALLDGHTAEFQPPAPPARGFQIHLPPFTVHPNSEREIYFMRRSPNTSDVFVKKFEVAMRNHSHHFILYRNSAAGVAEGVVRDFNPTMADFIGLSFLLGSQESSFSYEFPEGVALRLPAQSQLDLNSHYVNPGTTPIQGEAYVNIHTQDAPPERLAESFLYSDPDLYLPPNATTTHTGFTPPLKDAADLLMLTSHMHKRGTLFRIFKQGGAEHGKLLYENSRWDTPNVVTFDPPLRIAAGETLRYEVTYTNETSRPITFGFTSEDEMCVVVGYYALVK